MTELDATEPVRRRVPDRRDLLMAATWVATVGIVALPACAGPTFGDLTASLDLGPQLVPRGARLAGGLASPVAVLALALRLRRPSSELLPDERHLAQGVLSLTAALAGYALGGPEVPPLLVAAIACLVSSVAGGSLLLAPRLLLGAWRGVKLFVRLLGATLAVAVLAVVLVAIVVLPMKALGQTTPPPWLRWWFQLAIPTVCALFAVAAAWVSAAEAEQPTADGPPTSPAPASPGG